MTTLLRRELQLLIVEDVPLSAKFYEDACRVAWTPWEVLHSKLDHRQRMKLINDFYVYLYNFMDRQNKGWKPIRLCREYKCETEDMCKTSLIISRLSPAAIPYTNFPSPLQSVTD